jgi:hypothetical protein
MIKSKTLNRIGVIVLIITGINALAAGFSMIADPTGNDLGMSVERELQHSPFNSFLIPGLILFTTIGVLSIITALFFVKKLKYHEFLVIMQGAILFGWIFFQVYFLQQFNWLHATFGIIGILILGWGFLLYRINRKVQVASR